MTPPELPVLRTLADVQQVLQADKPALLLAWADESPRRDAEIALQEVLQKHSSKLSAFLVDAREDADLATHLAVGRRAVLIGWVGGEGRLRRSRPWKTDVPALADDLLALAAELGGLPEEPEAEEAPADAPADDAPVHVTAQTFQQTVIDSPVPVLVDFWADWCQPCKMVAPILDRLAKEFAGKVRIAKVDVDAEQALAGQFGVQSIPTLMFVKSGKIVGQSAGAAPEPALRDAINQLIALQV